MKIRIEGQGVTVTVFLNDKIFLTLHNFNMNVILNAIFEKLQSENIEVKNISFDHIYFETAANIYSGEERK